ncbi:maleylpyruvate isomerase N-terminal domain-containing protein [Streptomyces sp. NPDC002530]
MKITESLVNQVDASLLDRPTPCGQWTLRQLLAHMTGQNYGFAASAVEVTAAFAEEGVLERSFWLPEIRGGTGRGGRDRSARPDPHASRTVTGLAGELTGRDGRRRAPRGAASFP